MILVTWEPSKYKMGLISVNGEPWREMALYLLKKNPFQESYSSIEEWNSVWMTWEKQVSKQIAYDKLSRKSYLTIELKKALSAYGFSSSVLDEVLLNLKSLGYLNDEEYRERFINLGIKKKKSPLWIKQRLRMKGSLGFDEAEYPQPMREAIIRELLLKNQKKGKKAIATVVRKGFSFEDVFQVYSKNNFY